MNPKIKTAILGYGRSGSTMHAGAIEKNDDFVMTAVCDIDPERQDEAAERFGCRIYTDYKKMLSEEELDIVCVVTRSDQHCGMTCDCLEAGVDVLVTKPWAVNAAEGERMEKAEKESGRRIFPWLPARWGSDLKRLRELLVQGVIGKPFMIRRTVVSFGVRDDWQTEKKYGGGYILNWGPHIVDPSILLAGSPAAQAYGRTGKVNNPGDGEDFFFALLTCKNGIIITAEFAVSSEDLPNWVVMGDRGTILVRGKELVIHRQVPSRPSDPTKYTDMKAEQESVETETLTPDTYGDADRVYREIAGAFRNGTPFAVTSKDALELSRVLDGIRDAAETGKVSELLS